MENSIYKRREFLENMVKAGTLGIVGIPKLQSFILAENLTVNQIIEKILSELPGARQNETVDTLKSGSGDQVVTGIVTTMFATVQVIREAIKIKANFIIAHEPTYYNHLDDTRWVENNIVVTEKKELLEKNRITVWRFHDYWHRMKPDGIKQGLLLKAGWSVYNPNADDNFRIPAQKMENIINHLKEKLHVPHVRYIGDKTATCSNICLIPGAGGGKLQLSSAIAGNADLIIVGESSEWETPEYVRDARAFGFSISMIILGHAFSEDPGMDYLAAWLQPKIPAIPVKHITSGEPFNWA
jgi:putative NIF3 family GTP cyclohydrolase 1 type 2